LNKIEEAITSFQPDICILQDYNKGVFTKNNIPRIIELLKKHDILIAVDPKKANFFEYKDIDLFKPNAKEVAEALNITVRKADKHELKNTAIKLSEKLNFKHLILTLSEYGAMSYSNNNFEFIPAKQRAVVDVSGAGDTVIALAALLLAAKVPIEQILELTNLAGGLMVEQKGVNSLHIEDFLDEIQSN
jgi:rfaE bifunctional protein kinase chain/domain